MKYYIEKIIRKYKNPFFKFDEKLSTRTLLSLLIDMLFSWIRSFKLLFSFIVPSFIFFGKNVKVKNTHNIKLGKWIVFEDNVYIQAMGRQAMLIGDGCRIGAYTRLVTSSSYNNLGEYIRLGNKVGLGSFSSIGGSGGVSIGANTIIGQYFSAHPENHIFTDTHVLIKDQGTERAAITIEENCWIGAKVTVTAGVTIGENSIIGAGSVVTKNIPSNSIAVGNPAKVIKNRKKV